MLVDVFYIELGGSNLLEFALCIIERIKSCMFGVFDEARSSYLECALSKSGFHSQASSNIRRWNVANS